MAVGKAQKYHATKVTKKSEQKSNYVYFFITLTRLPVFVARAGGVSCLSLRLCAADSRHFGHFQRASSGAVSAFDAIGVEQPVLIAFALVRFQLHWADCRAEFAFGRAIFSDDNAAVTLGQIAFARSHP